MVKRKAKPSARMKVGDTVVSAGKRYKCVAVHKSKGGTFQQIYDRNTKAIRRLLYGTEGK